MVIGRGGRWRCLHLFGILDDSIQDESHCQRGGVVVKAWTLCQLNDKAFIFEKDQQHHAGDVSVSHLLSQQPHIISQHGQRTTVVDNSKSHRKTGRDGNLSTLYFCFFPKINIDNDEGNDEDDEED